jgi:hypothetical protein
MAEDSGALWPLGLVLGPFVLVVGYCSAHCDPFPPMGAQPAPTPAPYAPSGPTPAEIHEKYLLEACKGLKPLERMRCETKLESP